MKFRCSVDIDLSRDKVVELFDNPDNMQHWQDGFVSFEHISGTPGEVGAQSHVTYDMRGKKMVLLETVTVKNLPNAFHGTYQGDFGKNTMHNYFEVLDPNKTRWRAELDYIQMNGFMMKMMARLMPGMFRKQTQKWMDQFKEWSEEQIAESRKQITEIAESRKQRSDNR